MSAQNVGSLATRRKSTVPNTSQPLGEPLANSSHSSRFASDQPPAVRPALGLVQQNVERRDADAVKHLEMGAHGRLAGERGMAVDVDDAIRTLVNKIESVALWTAVPSSFSAAAAEPASLTTDKKWLAESVGARITPVSQRGGGIWSTACE